MEGQGIGFNIVDEALNEAEKRNLKVAPLCPFVAAYIRRNPEWKRMLAENFTV